MKARAQWAALGLTSLVVTIALAESGGPIPSLTGAPSEGLCTDCHADFAVNIGGAVALLDAPAYYRGGSTYTITARVSSGQQAASANHAWGFQLTAIDAGGAGVGTLAKIDGQGTKIIAGSGPLASRRYLEQDATGTRDGLVPSADWSFRWTAPPAGSGPVTFHLAGLAANGDASESGDWVYSATAVINDSATAVVGTSWGGLKHAYR